MKDMRVFIALFLHLFCRLEILSSERLKKIRGSKGRRQQRRRGGERAGSCQPRGDMSPGRKQRLQEGEGWQGNRGG